MLKRSRQLSRRPSIQSIVLAKNPFGDLIEKLSGEKFTSTMRCVGTAASGGLNAPLWTATIRKRGLYFNTMSATGMDSQDVTQKVVMKSLPH